MQLKDQVAIVTGGARGIGAGICKIFCEQGATVVMWDVIDGTEAADKIEGSISFQKVDITDRAGVQKAVDSIMAEHGRIDILINNAGIVRDRSFAKMSEQEWDSVINVNLNGIFNCTKAVLPYMKERKYGRIISASSVNAVLGAFGQTNYAATKAAIIGFTKSLAREVGKDGITVNAVAPGFVLTEMTMTMPPEMLKAAEAAVPVKRGGTPEDMGYAYLYLASPQAGYVNGHVLHVNGGLIS